MGGKQRHISGESKKSRHLSGESTMSSESSYIPLPPDGGWGWVVCLASFINHVIVDGISFTFGIFYIEFKDYFNASPSKIALVGSLLCGCYLMTGPIASALTNKFGCRPVCICGSLISCAAFLLSTVSPNVDILILTYGVMGGIGFGLIYLPSVISVSYYFERRRAMATGIAVCGAGVGTFAFAPLGRYLLEILDWKNAMFIMAGLVLNACVMGALFRPLEPPKRFKKPRAKNFMDRIKEQAQQKLLPRNRNESECSQCKIEGHNQLVQRVHEAKLARQEAIREDDSESEMSSMPSVAWSQKRLDRQDSKQLSRNSSFRAIKEATPDEIAKAQSPSTPNGTIPQIVVNDDKVKEEEEDVFDEVDKVPESKSVTWGKEGATPNGDITGSDVTGSKKSMENGKVANGHVGQKEPLLNGHVSVNKADLLAPNGLLNVRKDRLKSVSETEVYDQPDLPRKRFKRPPGVSKEDYSRPMYRQDIFYSGSVLAIPQFRSQPDCRSYVKSITTIPGEFRDEVDGITSKCQCIPKSARDTLFAMLDLTIFKDPVFLICCLTNVCGMLGMYIPFIYLPQKAMTVGIQGTQAAFLLSVIGITNTLGRVLSGVLADFPQVNSLLLHNIAIVMGGASCLSIQFLNNYAALCSYAAVFGLCIATWISLTSIILCNLMGLEKLTNAFGMLTLTRGISVICGPPIAGMLYESTGSLDSSFFVGGAMLILAGLISFLLCLPYFSRRKKHIMELAVPEALPSDDILNTLEEEAKMLKDFKDIVGETESKDSIV